MAMHLQNGDQVKVIGGTYKAKLAYFVQLTGKVKVTICLQGPHTPQKEVCILRKNIVAIAQTSSVSGATPTTTISSPSSTSMSNPNQALKALASKLIQLDRATLELREAYELLASALEATHL
jgi:hypothetical protein